MEDHTDKICHEIKYIYNRYYNTYIGLPSSFFQEAAILELFINIMYIIAQTSTMVDFCPLISCHYSFVYYSPICNPYLFFSFLSMRIDAPLAPIGLLVLTTLKCGCSYRFVLFFRFFWFGVTGIDKIICSNHLITSLSYFAIVLGSKYQYSLS